MYFMYGILGGLVVLLLFGFGVLLGLLLSKHLPTRAPLQPELTPEEAVERENERRRLTETQTAFHLLQNYSAERAYGMINDTPAPAPDNGGGT